MSSTPVRVLYIDSDDAQRASVEAATEEAKLPYDLHSVSSLREAKTWVKDFKPDVLLSSFQFEDGTASQLLQLVKKVPLIVLVDSGHEELAARALREGADDYLIRTGTFHHLKLLGLTIDNTLRRRRQKDTLQMLSHAVMRASDSVYLTSTDDTIIFVNDAFVESHGYGREEILGAPSRKLFAKSESESVDLLIRDPLRDCKGVLAVHRRKDGSLIPVYLSRSVIRDEQQSVLAILSIARAVADLEQAREQKQHLDLQLAQGGSVEVISKVTKQIAEEMGTLIGLFDSARLGLEAELQEPSAIARRALDDLAQAQTKARGFAEQLLQFSFHEPMTCTTVRLDALVHDCLHMLEETVPDNVALEEFHAELCPLVMADTACIHQVLRQIISCAIRNMGKSGGTLSFRLDMVPGEEIVSTDTDQQKRFVRLRIRDTGAPMRSAQLDEIFEPKFPSGTERKQSVNGLALAQLRIRRHQGALLVKADPQEGNCFDLFLPILEAAAEPVAVSPVEEHAVLPVAKPKHKRILFVDDEIPLVKLAALVLSREGFKVTACSTSAEALQRFEQDPWQFDVVVADQTMPKMRGDLLGKIVLGMRPGIPIILCAGYTPKLTGEIVAQLGFKRLLCKPYRFSDLSALIREVLAEVDAVAAAEIPAESSTLQ